MSEKTEEELAAEKEAQEKVTEARKAAAEATKLQEERLKALNEQGGLNRKQLEEINGALRDQLSSYSNINELTDEYRAVIQNIAGSERELAKAKGEGNLVLVAQLESIQKNNKARKEELEIASKGADENKKIVPGLKDLGEEIIRNTESISDQTEKMSALQIKLDRVTDSSYGTGLAINSFTSVLSTAGLEAANFSAGGFEMAKQLTEIGMKYDAASKAVEINTGLGQQSVSQMKSLVSENYSLGVTTEQASKAIGALNSQYSGFVGLNEEAQKGVAETVLTLERLGVSAETSGRAFDILDRGMGLGAAGAKAAVEDLDKLGQELGLPTAKVAEDFTKLGPKLARFGKQGKAQFDKLSKEARSLGLDVSAAFDIAEAFDTFEGAADMAGKLNAQLGLQLNSVNMMKGTHEERLKMLRQEFTERGKNFDQMNRRQQQAVAEMMGVDVDVAAKLFGDPIKYQQYIKDQEDARDRAERLTAAQDKLAAVADRLMVAFGPVLTIISGIASVLAAGPIPHLIALLTGLVGVYVTWQKIRLALLTTQQVGLVMTKSETLALMARNAVQKIKNFLGFTASVQEGKDIVTGQVKAGVDLQKAAAEKTLARAKMQGAAATGAAGTAASSAIPFMLALGAAALMVGAGIYLAATGMGNFVSAFAELNVEQMIGAGIGLVGMAAGIWALVAALPALAVTAGLTWPVLLALGGALMMIGAGIALIGAGAAMAFDAVANVIQVVSEVKGSEMEEVDKLLTKMVDVQMAGQFANVPALTIIADAMGFGGGDKQEKSKKTIELKVNTRTLGDVVVDILQDRYGMDVFK